MEDDRDALRTLQLDDCFNLELQQILKMTSGKQRYDAMATLREMLG